MGRRGWGSPVLQKNHHGEHSQTQDESRNGQMLAWFGQRGYLRLGKRGDKTVPTSRDGLDVPRCICIVSQGLPQLPDCGADTLIEGDDGAARPEPALYFLPGDDLTCPLQQ